jgi:hypothetical protein
MYYVAPKAAHRQAAPRANPVFVFALGPTVKARG